MPILGSFLRKNQRALKLSTLLLLDCLLKNYRQMLYPDLLQPVIIELPPLLDESDLHIAQWTLVILKSIAGVHPKALQNISKSILPEVMNLVKSPLLQGAALNSMLEFFQALVMCRLPGLSYNELVQMLISPILNVQGKETIHKQAYYSLAKCVAAITVICPTKALPVVQQFIYDIQNARSDSQHIFGLLIIGEIGRNM